jgi:hypothetical protein
MRGLVRVTQDWRLLAATVNLARLAPSAPGIDRAPGRSRPRWTRVGH